MFDQERDEEMTEMTNPVNQEPRRNTMNRVHYQCVRCGERDSLRLFTIEVPPETLNCTAVHCGMKDGMRRQEIEVIDLDQISLQTMPPPAAAA